MSIARRGFLASMAATVLASPSRAAAMRVTDIAGRDVAVPGPVRRMILGEGRQTYLTAALDKANPFGRVVGWRDDFRKADFDGYTIYEKQYPAIGRLPAFGGWKDGAFDIEQVIALRPDVVVMNLEAKVAIDDGGLIGKLDRVGIPVVFIDFREKPFEHAERSIAIMAQLLGRENEGRALTEYRAAQIARVTERLRGYSGPARA